MMCVKKKTQQEDVVDTDQLCGSGFSQVFSEGLSEDTSDGG